MVVEHVVKRTARIAEFADLSHVKEAGWYREAILKKFET